MKVQSGNEYTGSSYGKALFVSEAKVGKSCYLMAGALGILPWQKEGGVVSKPENLFVIAYDTDALKGFRRFALETCGAPKEALNYTVFNLEDDLRTVMDSDDAYNMAVYNNTTAAIQQARERMKDGVSVLLFSSATMMAAGVERGVVGAPTGKGYGDQSKWVQLRAYLTEIQNWAQKDVHHTWWEAHLDKSGGGAQNGGELKEALSIAGKAGRNWPINCSHVFRIRRNFGTPHVENGKRTACDQVYLDTRPKLDFVSGGRNVTESLAEKEYDPTSVMKKLEFKVGHWGAK
jgi:hypothetical protein